MADNRSLDEFLDAGEAIDESAASAASEAEAGDVEAATAVAEHDDAAAAAGEDGELATVEPAAETFAWSSAGGPCARCGETGAERWRDDGELVCPDCKAW